MNITVYGKIDCKMCSSAKEKLLLMGHEFESKDLESSIAPTEGWRDDETVDVLAGYTLKDQAVPLIRVNGLFYTYPEAMRFLKGKR